MSFDLRHTQKRETVEVSIPLEQGNVFRQLAKAYKRMAIKCLNPFGTGQCLSTLQSHALQSHDSSQSLWNRAMSFDNNADFKITDYESLNPFGTGQCLSTKLPIHVHLTLSVSIPLEQGNVFRLVYLNDFDRVECLNPFGTGQCLSTAVGC